MKIAKICLFLILLASALLSSCASHVPPVNMPAVNSKPVDKPSDQYLEQGIALVEKGQYQEAIDNLTTYVDYYTNSARAYYYRGYAYSQQQQFDMAVADLSRAIKINPGYIEAYYERSKAYYYKGDWSKAVTDATSVLEIDPQFPAVHYLRGMAYIKEKEYGKAVNDLELAGYMVTDADVSPDLQKLINSAVPVDDLVLLDIDMSSQRTGMCIAGTCSAPIGYSITLRAVMFANPGTSGIQVDSANVAPDISWMSRVELKGSASRLGILILAANVASAQPVSEKVTCSVNYKSGNVSSLKETNTVKN